jgi:precorrin-6B methylase 1
MPAPSLERITTVMSNMNLSSLQKQAIVTIRDSIANHEHLVMLCREVREMTPAEVNRLLRTNPLPGARIAVHQIQKGRDSVSSLRS